MLEPLLWTEGSLTVRSSPFRFVCDQSVTSARPQAHARRRTFQARANPLHAARWRNNPSEGKETPSTGKCEAPCHSVDRAAIECGSPPGGETLFAPTCLASKDNRPAGALSSAVLGSAAIRRSQHPQDKSRSVAEFSAMNGPPPKFAATPLA